MHIVIAFRNWPMFSGFQEVFIVVIAREKESALSAVNQVLDLLEGRLAELGIAVLC
jgi:hypothetical protein